MKPALRVALAVSLGLLALAACSQTQRPAEVISPTPAPPLVGHPPILQDTAPKEDLRLVPAEAYMKSYLTIFGGDNALDVQKRAREGGLFDSWDDYFSALGFPDYRIDLPRGTQTNAVMIATFERLGVALCDRAVEQDLKAKPPAPVPNRRVFAFDLPAGAITEGDFAPRFDVLHRTFLGYPAKLAPTDRTRRFFTLYNEIVTRHGQKGAPKSRFSPQEAAWASVCYGLVRHPEFHLY